MLRIMYKESYLRNNAFRIRSRLKDFSLDYGGRTRETIYEMDEIYPGDNLGGSGSYQ